MPSVSRSINIVFTESVISPSATLDKDCFIECLTKYTQQSVEHSAKSPNSAVK
jgi:hypothetical protein